jgi:alkaline phosphatase D
MAIAARATRGLTRRQLLVRTASTAALAGVGSLAKPYLSRAAERPLIASGIQSGDVTADSAMIWARADRPARMRVECAADESFKTMLGGASADALPGSDFTAKLLLDGLPPGRDVFYRVQFESLAQCGIAGEPQVGHFRTAPRAPKSVSFVWSGDTAGQGFGIDPALGGMRTYRTMLQDHPDFFIHSGDHIYADCPVPSELKLPDGQIWRNIITQEKSAVAQTLGQFRGNYKYNWLDENFRAFHSQVPMFAQWDDHEVTNDWSPIGSVDATGYAEDGTSLLVALARRAFFEFMPIREIPGRTRLPQDCLRTAARRLHDRYALLSRSHLNRRDDNSDLYPGAAQLAWLSASLSLPTPPEGIAADLPIGLISADAIALGDGPPERREHEIADLLFFMKHAGIRNPVADRDMHYTAAHRYDPNRAMFRVRAVLNSSPALHADMVTGRTRQHLWPQGDVSKGCSAEQWRQSRRVSACVILRPRRYRR